MQLVTELLRTKRHHAPNQPVADRWHGISASSASTCLTKLGIGDRARQTILPSKVSPAVAKLSRRFGRVLPREKALGHCRTCTAAPYLDNGDAIA